MMEQISILTRPALKLSRLTARIANLRAFSNGRIHLSDSESLSSPPFEEERIPGYVADHYYPVHIGEVFAQRYKVVGKLGYGVYSTVWLCRDLRDASLAALKVGTQGNGPGPERELKLYEHLASFNSEHPGQAFVRGVLDSFEVKGPIGHHICMVQPPMHITLRELRRQFLAGREGIAFMQPVLRRLLYALSFLHDEAGVVHTDIHPGNIMLTVADEAMLTNFERAEADDPSPTKIISDTRTIYGSRRVRLSAKPQIGYPVLCDFGEARIGSTHSGLIQPDLFRAPEVIFRLDWSSSVDIWGLAPLIWDLSEGRQLFEASDENGKYSANHHVAEMFAYLGKPSGEYAQQNKDTSIIFDEDGSWKGAGKAEVPQTTLEAAEQVLEGEEKELLLDLVRSMLTWEPGKRKGASELLNHPWLQEDGL